MKKLRYYPELNKVTGGITSTILMLQLEYWFEHTDGNAFFKFLEPCEDMQYRKGDSWSEETGFSKGEFRTAFARIGKVYKSKREFNESQDKFQGKMYLSYFDRIKRLTFYMRNTEVVEQYLNMEEDTKQISTSEEDGISRDEDIASPISLDYAIESIQDKESSVPYQEIVKVYHETCEELPRVKSLTLRIKQRISKIWKQVRGDMQTIKEAFAKMHASDFLSGRIAGKTWQADLAWVMQRDKLRDVLGDKYAVNYNEYAIQDKSEDKRIYNRETKPKHLRRFSNMMSHNWDFAKLEAMEEQYIQEKAKDYNGLESALLYKIAASNLDPR